MTQKQTKIARCLATFIDRNYYPDYLPSDADWDVFFAVESKGRKGIAEPDMERIKPLFEAKGDYDLQIRMVMSEVAEWWANGWGWVYPLNDIIGTAEKNPDLAVYVEALEKIKESFKRDSLQAILDYSGFTENERDKFLKRREQNLNRQLAKA